MKTAVILSTRGFGIFRFHLLKERSKVRFVGIFSEQDVANLPEGHQRELDAIHVVPCGNPNAGPLECSLVDADSARAIIKALLAKIPVEQLSIHSYDEQNVLLAAELRSEFGVKGPKADAIRAFRDKCLMKERLVVNNVRVPKFGRYEPEKFTHDDGAYFHQIVTEVGLPFILKPVDSAGADGVRKITTFAEFATLPGDFGRGYEYEEFIQGTMYSVNIVSKDKETIFGGVTEYLVNSFDVQAGRVNADINLDDRDPRVARMVTFAERALAALGWPDGASHLELFLTANDELVFLEVAARFKGMAGLAAMERNYGIAFVNLAFEVETGIESWPSDTEQVYCFDGVLPKRRGVIADLKAPSLKSEVAMTWKVRQGDVVDQTNSLLANAGTFLVWNKDYDTLYADFRRLAAYEPIAYQG